VEVLATEGIENARVENLYGWGREFQCSHGLNTDETRTNQRDIDVLFVGNFHQAVRRERLPWLLRIAQLGYRWRVCLRTGAFGDEYRQLLSRSRIVFNRSIRGEANQRVFEALAGGALLFQEAGHLPAAFDLFRVEWEKAAWENGGDLAGEGHAKVQRQPGQNSAIGSFSV
jgi:hypothetical protein